jgi:hypothetical protein
VSEGRRLTRRRFLVLGGAALGAGAVVIGTRRDEGYDAHTVAVRLVAGFTDPASAGVLGAAYLSAHPAERDEGRLVRGLRRANRALSGARRPEDVRRLARAELRRDYAAGRMVAVDGWRISLTEARLCALVTFVKPDELGHPGSRS